MPKRLRWADKQQQIYALLDPRDNSICYVGRSDDVQYRLYQHLQAIGDNDQTKGWIRELRQTGLSPSLLILETIDVNRNASAVAREREQYWIQEMLRKGYFLLNVSGVTQAYPKHDVTVRPSKVRELRIKAALNVSRLATLADVSRPTIEKMENDEPVRPDLASAVCRVLSEKLGYEVTIESAEIKVL